MIGEVSHWESYLKGKYLVPGPFFLSAMFPVCHEAGSFPELRCFCLATGLKQWSQLLMDSLKPGAKTNLSSFHSFSLVFCHSDDKLTDNTCATVTRHLPDCGDMTQCNAAMVKIEDVTRWGGRGGRGHSLLFDTARSPASSIFPQALLLTGNKSRQHTSL